MGAMQLQVYYYSSSRQPQVPCGVLCPPWSPSIRSPPLRPPLVLQCPTPAPRSARDSSFSAAAPILLEQQVLCTDSDSDREKEEERDDALLVVRRPFKEETEAESRGEDGWVEEEAAAATATGDGGKGPLPATSVSRIDAGLNEFAKRMPMFEPLERVGAAQEDRPLGVNLELWLYRAKVLTRDFQFGEAEKILRKCISFWPEDGRSYVALGKLLSKQSKFVEARSVYERGSQATQGENPYIWQCWAVLEKRMGNIRRARELFDAATVADKKHVAAWHGWAVLEIKQGNIKKARNLLGKGLKYCGANEYIYQTLALLEAKGKRIEQARFFFNQATLCNPKSCASWLAWAQVEMQQENNQAARQLFQAWGWMEWKEGNISTARELYQWALSIDSTSESAARCLQAWGVLEQRLGNLTAARRLFRSSLTINSQSFITWMTWASLEEEQGNPIRAEEIRNLYLQQRTEVVDDASWVMGFSDFIDPAIDSIKRLLNFDQDSSPWAANTKINLTGRENGNINESSDQPPAPGKDGISGAGEESTTPRTVDFDLDAFIKDRLSLDASELDAILENPGQRRINKSSRRVWRSEKKIALAMP